MQRAAERGVVAELRVADDEVTVNPAARICRSSVNAIRHFGSNRTVADDVRAGAA